MNSRGWFLVSSSFGMGLLTISWAGVASATILFCLLNALPVPEDGSSLDTYSPQDVELIPVVHSSVEDTRPKLHLSAVQKRAIVEVNNKKK